MYQIEFVCTRLIRIQEEIKHFFLYGTYICYTFDGKLPNDKELQGLSIYYIEQNSSYH